MSFFPNPRSGGGGGSFVINDNHFFADDTERDAYFVTNPGELITGTLIKVDTGYQQYNGSSWTDVTAVVTGPAGADGTDGEGVPDGGTTGQILKKKSDTDQDVEWGDGGGAGTGDMTKAVYDSDDDGVVDDSTLWDGQALPDIDSATGEQVLRLKSDKSALEFATVEGGGSGITWNEVTGTSQAAAVDTGYICNNAELITVTLPSTCGVGKIISIAGKGAGLWKIALNASQVIYFGDQNTTSGTAGYLAAQNRRDCVELICITADTEFIVKSVVGNLMVV